MIIKIGDTKIEHSRTVYQFLDLLGDYGGLQGMFALILSILMAPYAEHAFLMEAIRKLYVAKTDDQSLFERPISDKHIKNQAKKRKIATKLTRE